MTQGTNLRHLSALPRAEASAEHSGAVALLRAVVEASQCLVAASELRQGVEAAIDALRRLSGLDRVYVFRDVPGSSGVRLFAESTAPDVAGIAAALGDRIRRDEAFPDVIAPLRAGRIHRSIHPQRTGENADDNEALGTRSDLMLPVMAAGAFWGIVGFDDRRTDRHWSNAEVQALQGIATGIAAAVQREAAIAAHREADAARLESVRSRAEEAEASNVLLAQRDALLDAVAKMSHELLGAVDWAGLLPNAFRRLGEAARIHRVLLLKSVTASLLAAAIGRQAADAARLVAEQARGSETLEINCLLEGVVSASRALIEADDFAVGMNRWLAHLAASVQADRAIYGNFSGPPVAGSAGGEAEMAKLLSGQVAHVHRSETTGALRTFLESQGNETVVAVPIVLDNAQWGCLSFDYPTRRDPNSGDAAVLQTAADTLAAILKRNEAATAAIAEREARIAVGPRRFSELAQANNALRVSLDALAEVEGEEGFFRQSLLQIAAQAGARSAYLFASDAPGSTLRLDDGRGVGATPPSRHNGGFGMAGMQSRAAALGGTLDIVPSGLGGVAIRVEVPCRGAESEST